MQTLTVALFIAFVIKLADTRNSPENGSTALSLPFPPVVPFRKSMPYSKRREYPVFSQLLMTVSFELGTSKFLVSLAENPISGLPEKEEEMPWQICSKSFENNTIAMAASMNKYENACR